uniref:18S rRNA (pseudouridine-N1)-methyltransferase n=1 Tax=Anisakis simplex TaxID=6269 RepID=A0A0M3KBI0_ANISI
LSSDKHANFLKNQKKDPANYRPDILHQCLLMLLDSPLNRANLLQIFIHTTNNVLIEVSPQTRIPRTFDRFCGLMVQLLHKLSIRAADSSAKLLKVIRNPVSVHLPVGCRKILTSFQANALIKCSEIAKTGDNRAVAIVVGGFARGKEIIAKEQLKGTITPDSNCPPSNFAKGVAEGGEGGGEEEIKISNFPLSAALTCAKLTSGFEEAWGVEQ